MILDLLKYVWPKDSRAIKTRVVVSLSLLVAGKVCGQLAPRGAPGAGHT